MRGWVRGATQAGQANNQQLAQTGANSGPQANPINEKLIILADVPVSFGPYAAGMNVTRHFSDTRTDLGRVRFLIHTLSGRVTLTAEGQAWHHSSVHDSLDAAAGFLALLPQVPQALYTQALDDLDRQVQFEVQYGQQAA